MECKMKNEKLKNSRWTGSELQKAEHDQEQEHEGAGQVAEEFSWLCGEDEVLRYVLEAQKKNIEILAKIIKEFENSFEKTAGKVSSLTDDIKGAVTKQSESLKTLTADIEKQLPQTLSELDKILAGLTKRFASDYESFLNHYQSLVATSSQAN